MANFFFVLERSLRSFDPRSDLNIFLLRKNENQLPTHYELHDRVDVQLVIIDIYTLPLPLLATLTYTVNGLNLKNSGTMQVLPV